MYRTGVAYEARGALSRLVRSPGQELEDVYWDFVYAPLLDANGAIEGVLVSGFEVTAQVRASHELSQLLTRSGGRRATTAAIRRESARLGMDGSP